MSVNRAQKAIEIWRTLHQSVLPTWYRQEILGFAPDISPSTEPNPKLTYSDVIGAAISMFAWTIALDLDSSHSIRREYEEFRRIRSTAEIWRALAGQVSSKIRGFVIAEGPDYAITRLVAARGLADLANRAAPANLALSGRIPTSSDDLLSLAWNIRKTSDIALKRSFIAKYIKSRYRFAPIGRRDHQRIAMADQMVHWDTVVSESTDLNLLVAHLIESGNPAEAGLGYRTHRFRSLAIDANKRNATAEANHWIDKGIKELLGLPELSEIEWRESAHQQALAAAGIRVRYLEYLLRVVPQGMKSARIALEAHYALSFSGFAKYQLDALASGGLPDDLMTARSEGRIAAASWNVQTRIIRLRAALGARTAIEAQLYKDKDEVLDGLVDDSERLVYDDGYLTTTYRELISRPELTTSHQIELCRLALWLAFLRGMRLPLSASVSRAFAHLLFLDGDPENIARGENERSLDPYDVIEWLHNGSGGGEDAGWLSWTKPSSAAAFYLNVASDSTYSDWRRNEAIRCKNIRPSHD